MTDTPTSGRIAIRPYLLPPTSSPLGRPMTRYWTEDLLEKLEHHNPWYRRAQALPPAHGAGPRDGGVNVCGYLRDESGWGAAGRGYVRALRSLGVPLALGDLS